MSEGRGESLRRLRELEAANRQLARERDDLRVLIDTPRNVMLFSFDLNYNYIAFNQAHREFVKHNWSLDIHPGMHVFDILSDPEERAAARRNFDRVLAGESYILRRKYRKPKGEIGFYQNTYVPIVRGGFMVKYPYVGRIPSGGENAWRASRWRRTMTRCVFTLPTAASAKWKSCTTNCWPIARRPATGRKRSGCGWLSWCVGLSSSLV